MSINPFLHEYRAALHQARAELAGLRPLVNASDDLSLAARLAEVDLSLEMIASDMHARTLSLSPRERLVALRQRLARARRGLAALVIGRWLGGFPWREAAMSRIRALRGRSNFGRSSPIIVGGEFTLRVKRE
jgi:hypothetical protein